MTERLWAKSWDSRGSEMVPEHVFLPQHLHDVLAAADDVLTATGGQQLRAFGLDVDSWLPRFRRVVRLAAAVHDLGKANDHFQGMILKRRDRVGRPQGLRHEWVTWLMLQDEWLGSWLRPAIADRPSLVDDWRAMLWCVTGHHAAYGRPSPPIDLHDGVGSEMLMHFDHDDFREALRWLAHEFLKGETSVPTLPSAKIGLRMALERIADSHSDDRKIWNRWIETHEPAGMLAFVAAMKNCLVAADVAGSAIPVDITDARTRRDWVRRVFAEAPTVEELNEVISDRLTVDGQRQKLRPFQNEVAERAGGVTLVKAGCGSGKTLAAYHWLRTRHSGRRLYLCYPTTGTATEGFRDYVFDESERTAKCGARLFHCRADVDEKLILGVADRADDDSEEDTLARIESLVTWQTPIVVCTVDTVLGVMQNNRRGLYAWPALAGAAFVFDEIHAFDSDLFGALLRFVRELSGAPVLLMTASLPKPRLEKLRKAVEYRGTELVEIGGPDEFETLPRYHRHADADSEAVLPLVIEELRRSDRSAKVLWVCNTVHRAMDAADLCAERGFRPLLYHSRFRYADRVEQHRQVIAAFKSPYEPSLAICTQVAEMSLDLSATLLVTDVAPISALIQRLGRLNRRARTKDAPTMPFVVVMPRNKNGDLQPLPYDEAELVEAERWLGTLPESISQRDLVAKWESLGESSRRETINTESTWLDGGPRREVKELRKGSPGITVVLERDLAALRETDPAKRLRLAEVLLPMPRPRFCNWRDWPEHQGIKIAPTNCVTYDAKRGGQWFVNELDKYKEEIQEH